MFEVRALTAKPVKSGEWTYAAVIRQGDNLLIYVNGELQVQASGVSGLDLTNTAKLIIGHHSHWQTAPDNAFVGQIDEVRLSNSAKSSEQIKANWLKLVFNQSVEVTPITAQAEPDATAQATVVPAQPTVSQTLADLLNDSATVAIWMFQGAKGSPQKQTDLAQDLVLTEGQAVASDLGSADQIDESYRFVRDTESYLTAPGFNPNTSDFTLELGFKANGTTGETMILMVKQEPTGSYRGYVLSMTAEGKITFTFNGGSGGIDVRSPGTYADGLWHSVAAVRQGDNLLLYVDGQLVNQKTGAAGKSPDNASPLVIGAHEHFGKAPDNALAGLIDWVRLSRSARTPEEILAVKQATTK